MKKTKIVCTMGPNTDNREIMRELALNGMDVARFNFSHGDHAEHKHRLEILESVREELGIPIASLLDTKGPEIRTGKLKDGKKVTLKEGDLYTLTTEEIVGDETRGYINYAGLAEDVKPGDRILIDDGLIELHVREVNGTDIVCRIENGGELGAIINLDDFTHIDFLEKTIGYIPETISCRYNPGGLFKISNDIMDNPGDAKYGMTTEQLFEAFRVLKAKGAKHFGIHAFLASNTVTNEYYPMLAKVLFEVAVKLKEETGADIKFINLSGGVGIPYRPDQEPNDIFAIGEGVRKVYEEVLVPAGMGDVALYTEMGRFMLAPYGCLVTTAIHEKHTYKEYIGVDACAVNLMRPAMYGAYHHITVMGKENEPCDHKYDVTGSLCENNDKFAIDRMLPKIDMGDILVIHDTGAHGFSMGYNYNGKLRSAELLLKEDGSVEMIRRAETPKDYFATFDFCDLFKNI